LLTIHSSYTWNTNLGCVSYFNPILIQDTTATTTSAAVTEGVTRWTVVVEYTSVAVSTAILPTTVVVGQVLQPQQTTSTTDLSTTTGHQIVSGQEEAIVIGPSIAIRWASTDDAVLSWIRGQITSGAGSPNSTETPTDTPKGNDSDGLSGGAIAGVVIGAIAALALVIAALLLFLRRRKQRAATTAYSGGMTQGMRS
jgi:hypothetical protein